MSESPTPAEPPPVAAAESEPSPRPSLSAHYHAARLRGDTWAELKRTLARLTGGTTAADRRALEAQAADALARLGPVESYWAFPGPQAFKHLVRLFERGDLEAASTLTNRIVRALASHTYRRRHVPLLPGDDDEEITEVEASDEASLPEGTHGRDRPYFEVLIVDNLAPADETAVRAGLHAIRRDEDEFVYDVVIVPSFEDAVIAVLFNFNIQTVVVRYDFPFASRHRLEVLEGYLAGLDEFRFSRHLAHLDGIDVRIIEQPQLEFNPQQAPDGFVDPFFAQFACFYQLHYYFRDGFSAKLVNAGFYDP